MSVDVDKIVVKLIVSNIFVFELSPNTTTIQKNSQCIPIKANQLCIVGNFLIVFVVYDLTCRICHLLVETGKMVGTIYTGDSEFFLSFGELLVAKSHKSKPKILAPRIGRAFTMQNTFIVAFSVRLVRFVDLLSFYLFVCGRVCLRCICVMLWMNVVQLSTTHHYCQHENANVWTEYL